ncbi:MAG: hypothetical protein ACRDMA_12980, partial [Solirubrobacterales bacterium]
GLTATVLVRDNDGARMPIMTWGTVHNLAPTEAAPARNTEAISGTCGVVSIIAIGGDAHFKQGDASVLATTGDAYLPEGEWQELPLFKGDAWSYVSIVSAVGSGNIVAQICERQ